MLNTRHVINSTYTTNDNQISNLPPSNICFHEEKKFKKTNPIIFKLQFYVLNPIKRTLKVDMIPIFFKSYITHIVIFHRRRSHFCHVFLYHPLNLFQINCKDVIHKIDFNVFGIFTAEEFFLSFFDKRDKKRSCVEFDRSQD